MVDPNDQIVVREYKVNAGYDVKFEADPCDGDLEGIVTTEEDLKHHHQFE